MYIVKDCIYTDPKKSDSKFYAFEPFWNLNVQIQAFIQGTASEVHHRLRRARGVVVEEAYDLVSIGRERHKKT